MLDRSLDRACITLVVQLSVPKSASQMAVTNMAEEVAEVVGCLRSVAEVELHYEDMVTVDSEGGGPWIP